MKFIAFTTKGLEFISEKEIKSKISDAQIIKVLDKIIIFETNADNKQLFSLRTVDDLGILILSLKKVDSLNNLISELENVYFDEAIKTLKKYREEINNDFSITTSIVGAKKITSSELVYNLSQKWQKKYSWNFTEFDHTNFDIRMFINKNIGYVSIRLTKESLQHRKYKTFSKEGSLKPTVAAGMVYLAIEDKTNLKIVDNFCGSGTILAESLKMGNEVYGGDIDAESVSFTKKNLTNLKYKTEGKINQLNAVSTKWQNNYFDCAISNLPWGKQVEIKSITELYEGCICDFVRILKPDGVLCVLVSNPELFVKLVKKYKQNPVIKTFKIGLLGQNPTIILVK